MRQKQRFLAKNLNIWVWRKSKRGEVCAETQSQARGLARRLFYFLLSGLYLPAFKPAVFIATV